MAIRVASSPPITNEWAVPRRLRSFRLRGTRYLPLGRSTKVTAPRSWPRSRYANIRSLVTTRIRGSNHPAWGIRWREVKPFDATVKDLAAQAPQDFIAVFDQPPVQPVRVLNVDLSTVTTAADIVFGVGDPLLEIVHLDAQSSAAADKHLDTLAYNSLLHRTYRVPVHSIVLMVERLRREAPPNQANRLLTAAFVLTGLRLARAAAFQLFRGVRAMRDSDTYQAILDEGRVDELHRTLLRQGRKRFGQPDEETRQAICGIQDPERLEELSERLLDVSTWDELLA